MNLFETASGLAVRYLDRDVLLALRRSYLDLRGRLSPLMRAVYGTFDVAELRVHLEQRIARDFDILMIHSSMNHLQPMYTGSPLALVRMLIDLCGPERTLAMPAFFFPSRTDTFRQQQRFDLRGTPSQMGLLTELFRRSRGVLQSRHPIYRVAALGPLAKELTDGHERAGTACGRGTPFDFMANHKTQIIGMGKRYEVLTQVHHVEDLMGDEFPVPATRKTTLTLTLVDGENEIAFESAVRSLTWRRNMWKLRGIMNSDTLQEWKFHHVPMFATQAKDVTNALLEAAKRGVTLYEKP